MSDRFVYVTYIRKRRGGDIWRRRPGCDPDAVWMRSRQSWGPKMEALIRVVV